MGTFTLINPTIWMGLADLTQNLRQITVATTVDDLDVTTFGSGGYVQKIGGLKDTQLKGEGFMDLNIVDNLIFVNLGVTFRVFTLAPQGGEGNPCYMFQGQWSEYQSFGDIGQPAPFSMAAGGSDPSGLVRGQIASAVRSVSGTGQLGSILTMTGPSATQYVYATLHAMTVGTSITVQIQSAPTAGFAAPTTRGTIGPISATGGTWMNRVIGPITDGFWRMNVSAITGSFTVAGAIGIGS